jgi:hypothetical protein
MCKSSFFVSGTISLLFVTKDSFLGVVTPIILERSLSSLVSQQRKAHRAPIYKLTHAAIYMIAVSSAADGYVRGQAYKALYATILGPFFLTILLMFVSGLPLSERPGAKKRYENGSNWEGYQRYLKRTSILVPLPPQLYERLPVIIKRTILLEFPMYVFDPAKHSDGAQGQRSAEEGNRQTVSSDTRQSGERLTST